VAAAGLAPGGGVPDKDQYALEISVSAGRRYLRSMSFADRLEALLRELDRLDDAAVLAAAEAVVREYRASETERERVLALGIVFAAREMPAPAGFAARLGEARRDIETE